MKTLVIYDSVYCNTEKIAKRIGASISEEARVLKVTDVNLSEISNIDFLIVGSPTRAFRPTKEITRFLNRLPYSTLEGVKVAAFDTRIAIEDVDNKILSLMVKLFGYADKPIESKLMKKGGLKASDSTGFIVLGSEGPLKDGELEKATEWAQKIINS